MICVYIYIYNLLLTGPFLLCPPRHFSLFFQAGLRLAARFEADGEACQSAVMVA